MVGMGTDDSLKQGGEAFFFICAHVRNTKQHYTETTLSPRGRELHCAVNLASFPLQAEQMVAAPIFHGLLSIWSR